MTEPTLQSRSVENVINDVEEISRTYLLPHDRISKRITFLNNQNFIRLSEIESWKREIASLQKELKANEREIKSILPFTDLTDYIHENLLLDTNKGAQVFAKINENTADELKKVFDGTIDVSELTKIAQERQGNPATLHAINQLPDVSGTHRGQDVQSKPESELKRQIKFQRNNEEDAWDSSIRSSILELGKNLPQYPTIRKEVRPRKRKQACSNSSTSGIRNVTTSDGCVKNDYDSESDKNGEGILNDIHQERVGGAEQQKINYLDMPEL